MRCERSLFDLLKAIIRESQPRVGVQGTRGTVCGDRGEGPISSVQKDAESEGISTFSSKTTEMWHPLLLRSLSHVLVSLLNFRLVWEVHVAHTQGPALHRPINGDSNDNGQIYGGENKKNY